MCQSNVNAKPQGGLDTTQRAGAHSGVCTLGTRPECRDSYTFGVFCSDYYRGQSVGVTT